jgi:hypothetical protein
MHGWHEKEGYLHQRDKTTGHKSRTEEDLVAIVKAFLATLNTHDVEAALAFFTDDAVLRTSTPSAPLDSEIAIGKQQIRSHLLGVLPGFHLEEAWDYQVSGESVSWLNKWSNDFFRNMGIDSQENAIKAAFQKDKIKSWTITYSPEEVEKLWVSLEE